MPRHLAKPQKHTLFEGGAGPMGSEPLAERVRPRTLGEIVGQEHLLGPGGPLRALFEQGQGASLILWGPPGTGKTTIARLLGAHIKAHIEERSAVLMSVKDVREIAAASEDRLGMGERTLLFVDEIHRMNRAQQDAFLPHVEAGRFFLVGATTENPSFALTAPLLSRARVFVLEQLTDENVRTIVERALADERGFGGKVSLDAGAREFIGNATGGDARAALGAVEFAGFQKVEGVLTKEDLAKALQRRLPRHDRSGEEHYNILSAFIKSLRGSDPDAALYYLARLLDGGEDPRLLARRMVILASEDISNADPHALTLAVSAAHAVEFVGMPECELNLAHIAVYLALAPKSNASYMAIQAAHQAVTDHPEATVPMNLRNAPTKLMKELGYHKGYQYDHNEEDQISVQRFLPEGVGGGFYEPTDHGAETKLKTRWEAIRAKRSGGAGEQSAPSGQI